jgi:hypothetical protein
MGQLFLGDISLRFFSFFWKNQSQILLRYNTENIVLVLYFRQNTLYNTKITDHIDIYIKEKSPIATFFTRVRVFYGTYNLYVDYH